MTNSSVVRAVVVGDESVGKTSVILSDTSGARAKDLIATIAADFCKTAISVDGKIHSLELWDTAGQERYRGISSSFRRRGQAILLFFAVNKASSFENVGTGTGLIEAYKKDVPVILVGNKIDLTSGRR
jgi:Ras-related protein Rab-1A